MRVQPRASREEVGGTRKGAIVVRLTAPPVQGRANAALLRLLGRILGVPPSAITLRRGASGPDKVLHVGGLRAEEARARLEAARG